MVDLQKQYLLLKSEIDESIQKVLLQSNFIKGNQVTELEHKLASFIEIEHCITCANGTDALQLAFMALNLPPKSEVLIPDFCYISAAEVVCLLGLIPVFLDVNPDTFNIDTSKIEENITENTRAIVAVHLFGQCCDMLSIIKIAQKYNLFIIEDAAQSLGASYSFSDSDIRMAGNMSHIATTSFFPSKNLGCYGDGGAVFTNDEHLSKKIRCLANHGQSEKYKYSEIGINSRLDTLQASILLTKLPHLKNFNQQRIENANQYSELLQNITQIEIPTKSKNSSHIFHQYTLKVKNGKRDALKLFLESKEIPTMIYYPLTTQKQKAYQKFRTTNFNLHSEDLTQEVLSLPMHPDLENEQIIYICEIIKDFYKK
ncbi:MAG: DegT/DnrJ/EryC1/StrS family aminotransferase [Cytophagales bacterium]|nr:MAG: DegT/DnrJ/EryC1/StrS family aminotransferase [Cytophagales bacterium]